MYQVMIVSEKRSVMRQIVSYLETESDYRLGVVLFSYNAVEQFARLKPDIVFLDTQIMKPYPFIIAELARSGWEHVLVLIGPDDQTHPNIVPTCRIPYGQLSRQRVIDAIASLASGRDSKAAAVKHRGALPTDLYHVVALFSPVTESLHNAALAGDIQKQFSPYADVSVAVRDGHGVIIRIRKSTLAAEIELAALIKHFLDGAGQAYFAPFLLDVRWSDVEAAEETLLGKEQLSYFLKGQSLDLESLKLAIPLNRRIIQSSVAEFAEASLHGDVNTADKLLRTLYMRNLKPNLDFSAVRFAEFILTQVLDIEGGLVGEPGPYVIARGCWIEEALSAMREPALRLAEKMRKRPLSRVVLSAIVMIIAAYEEGLFLAGVAETLGVNKIYLSRVFKEQTGMTFMELLQRVRLAASDYFLRNTELVIADVAQLAGYSNANYFSRQYKKEFGITPSQARPHDDAREGGI